MSPEWLGVVAVAVGAVLGAAGTLAATVVGNRSTESAARRRETRAERVTLYAATTRAMSSAWIWLVTAEEEGRQVGTDELTVKISPLYDLLSEMSLVAPLAVSDPADAVFSFLRDAAGQAIDGFTDSNVLAADAYFERRAKMMAAMQHDLQVVAAADQPRTESGT